MKKRRILSCFLSFLLLFCLTAPALAAEGDYVPPQDPDILARGALLMDLETGTQLYGRNERQTLYPASLTKIMTALLVIEAFDRGEIGMERMVEASGIVSTLPADSSTAGIKPGEVLTARQLMYCMLVSSANEAAMVLAEYVCGSVDAFVERMNQRAAELGCENTHFVNPHGFHDDNHYTTCWDMYLITREALKHDAFMTFCDTREYNIPATNLRPGGFTIRSTNRLINGWYGKEYMNPDAHGVKTGSTTQAGNCLISTARRGDLHLCSVIMGAEIVKTEDGKTVRRSFSETNRLLNWGFDNFRYKTIMTAEKPIEERPVALSKTDHVIAVTKDELSALMPANLEPEMLEQKIEYLTEELEAPVETGDELGSLTLSYGGTVYGTTKLLSSNGAELSKLLVYQRKALEIIHNPKVQLGAVAAAALILALGIWRLMSGRRRSRYGTISGGHTGRTYTGR